MTKQAMLFRGLGNGNLALPNRALESYYRRREIELAHGETNWHKKGILFDTIFDSATEQAAQTVEEFGQLDLIGYSAGGSLVINVYEALCRLYPEADLSAITLNAWLQNDEPGRLEYIGVNRSYKKASPAFVQSVERCAETAIPFLTEPAKQNITTVTSRYDGVVPISATTIEGVQSYTVPMVGHLASIAMGLAHVPIILESMEVASKDISER